MGEHDVTQSDGAEQRITPRYDEIRILKVYRDRVFSINHDMQA